MQYSESSSVKEYQLFSRSSPAVTDRGCKLSTLEELGVRRLLEAVKRPPQGLSVSLPALPLCKYKCMHINMQNKWVMALNNLSRWSIYLPHTKRLILEP